MEVERGREETVIVMAAVIRDHAALGSWCFLAFIYTARHIGPQPGHSHRLRHPPSLAGLRCASFRYFGLDACQINGRDKVAVAIADCADDAVDEVACSINAGVDVQVADIGTSLASGDDSTELLLMRAQKLEDCKMLLPQTFLLIRWS
ncbi:hypothetical protein ACLKA6_015239 [Drosophila palustris]